MSKVLTIVSVSILALTLVLGVALPALAAPDAAKPRAKDFHSRIVMGKVLSIGDQQFVIKSGKEELTISVNEDTEYYKMSVPGRIISLARRWLEFRHQNRGRIDIPTRESPKLSWLHPFDEEATFSDIEEGDRVVVWLAEDSESLLAERVEITKVTTYEHVSGTITAVSATDKTITITTDEDEEVTLTYNERTVFILKGIIQVDIGQSAKAVYDSDTLIAKTVTVNPAEIESTD
jgi:hypothetical protein